MSEPTPSRFLQKLAEKRAAQTPPTATATPEENFDDLLPTVPGRSDEDVELDRVIENIGIIDAYNRWCKKMQVNPADTRIEGIKVRCPIPTHPDNDPSAWLNTDKNVWFCGGCQQGGDVYDLAAFALGYPVPGYKDGARFHELRRDMAREYGYTFVRAPGSATPLIIPPATNPSPITEDAFPEGDQGQVLELFGEDDDEDITYPSLKWESLIEADSFLGKWMAQTTVDDVAEEYHFFHGLSALGLAVGRDVQLFDSHNVLANIFICVLGGTGSGKSKSRRYLENLLAEALPYNATDINPSGTKTINSPASAEALIGAFSKPIFDDPVNPKAVTGYGAVRGLVTFDELSALVGRTARVGNVLKPTLMEMYDGQRVVSTVSVTHGEKVAHNPFCNAITTTQPRVLNRLLTREDADSGFLNRWFFVAGPGKPRQAIGGVRVDVAPAVDALKSVASWAAAKQTITWEDDAANETQSFFEKKLWLVSERDDSGLLARLDLSFKKLCLLLAINQERGSVNKNIVERVIEMFPYLVECYAIPAAKIGNTVMHEIRETVLMKLNNGKTLSLREMNRLLARKKYPIDMLVKTLDYMVQLGEVEMLKPNEGSVGRPTVRYRRVD